jgi:hypothetical protein
MKRVANFKPCLVTGPGCFNSVFLCCQTKRSNKFTCQMKDDCIL